VADGARTGLASVVVGLLFLAAMFFSPLASVTRRRRRRRRDHRGLLHDVDRARHPVGRLRGGDSRLHDHAGDAFYVVDHQRDRAGFITYTVIKLLRGKGRQLHLMVYLASAAFVVYFACR